MSIFTRDDTDVDEPVGEDTERTVRIARRRFVRRQWARRWLAWRRVLVGVLLWGAAMGVQDSTVKALVADLVPAGTRASAYGVFAAVQGAAAVVGGVAAGALYERSLPALVGVVAGWVGLNLAFALPLIFCVVAVIVAPIVSRPADVGEEPVDEPVGSSYETDRA